MKKGISRREMLKLSGTVAAGSVLAAYGAAVAQTPAPPTVAPTKVPPTVVPPTAVPAVTKEGVYEVLSPQGALSKEITALKQIAPRVGDLNGKKIGIFNNTAEEADYILPMIVELLKARKINAEFLYFESYYEPFANMPPIPAILTEIASKVDTVIMGVGK